MCLLYTFEIYRQLFLGVFCFLPYLVTIDVEDTLDVGVGKPDLYTDTEGEPVVTGENFSVSGLYGVIFFNITSEIASSEVVAVGSRLSSRRKITFSHDKVRSVFYIFCMIRLPLWWVGSWFLIDNYSNLDFLFHPFSPSHTTFFFTSCRIWMLFSPQ